MPRPDVPLPQPNKGQESDQVDYDNIAKFVVSILSGTAKKNDQAIVAFARLLHLLETDDGILLLKYALLKMFIGNIRPIPVNAIPTDVSLHENDDNTIRIRYRVPETGEEGEVCIQLIGKVESFNVAFASCGAVTKTTKKQQTRVQMVSREDELIEKDDRPEPGVGEESEEEEDSPDRWKL